MRDCAPCRRRAAGWLASSDPKRFERWRVAVTDFHLKGWSQMTPQRVDEVVAPHGIQIG
jgi:hypothetical protein